jgi:hypothetical protein
MSPSPPSSNPRRVAAGKLNRKKRGPLTEAGRERLRQAALEHQPWLHATGPRSPEGKLRSSANGKWRQRGELSIREIRALVAAEVGVVNDMATARQLVAELLGAGG